MEQEKAIRRMTTPEQRVAEWNTNVENIRGQIAEMYRETGLGFYPGETRKRVAVLYDMLKKILLDKDGKPLPLESEAGPDETTELRA